MCNIAAFEDAGSDGDLKDLLQPGLLGPLTPSHVPEMLVEVFGDRFVQEPLVDLGREVLDRRQIPSINGCTAA